MDGDAIPALDKEALQYLSHYSSSLLVAVITVCGVVVVCRGIKSSRSTTRSCATAQERGNARHVLSLWTHRFCTRLPYRLDAHGYMAIVDCRLRMQWNNHSRMAEFAENRAT